jgi:putative spermidine/putrescine transport system substrate-binding protein
MIRRITEPRRAAWTVVFLCMTMLLAACGSNGETADTTAADGTGDTAPADTADTGDTGTSAEVGGELIVYDGGGAWGEAQRVAFFEPFTEETGIEVIPAVSPEISATQTAIEAGDPGLDVYSLADNRLGVWEENDYFEAIDFSLWPEGRRDSFEPYAVEDSAVPYLISAVQIAYDPEASEPIESWEDFWNTEGFPGPRSLSDVANNLTGGTIEVALLADGVAPEDLYPLDVERAFAKLDEIKAEIATYWIEGAEPIQSLIDGQVVASSAYNGRIYAGEQEGATLGSSWNQALLSAHYYTIPKGAANLEAAQMFLEFASRPEVQAAFSEAITYAPGNQEAYEHISEERQALLPTGPGILEQTVVMDPEFWNSDSPSGEPWNEAIINMWNDWLAGG